jgi:hypothetical protein
MNSLRTQRGLIVVGFTRLGLEKQSRVHLRLARDEPEPFRVIAGRAHNTFWNLTTVKRVQWNLQPGKSLPCPCAVSSRISPVTVVWMAHYLLERYSRVFPLSAFAGRRRPASHFLEPRGILCPGVRTVEVKVLNVVVPWFLIASVWSAHA